MVKANEKDMAKALMNAISQANDGNVKKGKKTADKKKTNKNKK